MNELSCKALPVQDPISIILSEKMFARVGLKRVSVSLGILTRVAKPEVGFHCKLAHVRTMSSGKSTLNISGVYPPIATPFDGNENISWEKLEQNINKWNKFDLRGKKSCSFW